MFRPAYNRTDRPLLIDAAGRQLGGREWGAVDTTSDEVSAAGELLVVFSGDVTDDTAPDVRAAVERAGVLEERRKTYVAADVDAVRKAAVAAGIVPDLDAAGDRTKTELQRELVQADIDPATLLPKARRAAAATPTTGGPS